MTGQYDQSHFLEPVDQIIRRLFSRGPLRKKAKAAEVWTAWPTVVGERIAAHARPVRLEGRTLTVLVDSAVWHHQMQFLEQDIVAKLGAHLGARVVTKLRFRTQG